MAVEIERKFGVDSDSWKDFKSENSVERKFIQQGYLSDHPTVRIRIINDQAMVTIKGQNEGIIRQEFEYGIPMPDAEVMMKMCTGVLTKMRHYVHRDGVVWEVDEFLEDNAGLIVAEVELPTPGHEVIVPEWATEELTDPKYFNSNLAKNPFNTWGE